MSSNTQVGWKAISNRVYELTNHRFTRRLCEKIRDMEVDSLTENERVEASILKNLLILDGDEITSRILMFEDFCFGKEFLDDILRTAEEN